MVMREMLKLIRRYPLLSGVTATLFIMVIAAWSLLSGTHTEEIDSFNSCTRAGYLVTEGAPPICHKGSYYVTGPIPTATSQVAAVQSEPFELLVMADSGTDTPRQQVVIRDQAAWVRWWADVHSGLTLPPLIPVDFTQHNVVMLIGGPKETTGYSYKVSATSLGKRSAVVDTLETIPTLGCPVNIRRSNRYYIISTVKLPEPVVFRNTEVKRQCK